jgi:hypothetical protein
MDRIYTIKDSDVQLFRDWARENGWYTKQYNSSTDSGRANAPDGTQVDLGTLTVDIKKGMYEAYPYLDTLKYFNPGKGTLSNRRTGGDEYILEDTGGELWRCEYCGGSGMQTCGDCDGDGSWECRRCDGEGERSCTECKGEGYVEDSEGNHTDCDSCGGDGKNSCVYCDGDGTIECDNCGGRGEHSCYECQ